MQAAILHYCGGGLNLNKIGFQGSGEIKGLPQGQAFGVFVFEGLELWSYIRILLGFDGACIAGFHQLAGFRYQINQFDYIRIFPELSAELLAVFEHCFK